MYSYFFLSDYCYHCDRIVVEVAFTMLRISVASLRCFVAVWWYLDAHLLFPQGRSSHGPPINNQYVMLMKRNGFFQYICTCNAQRWTNVAFFGYIKFVPTFDWASHFAFSFDEPRIQYSYYLSARLQVCLSVQKIDLAVAVFDTIDQHLRWLRQTCPLLDLAASLTGVLAI